MLKLIFCDFSTLFFEDFMEYFPTFGIDSSQKFHYFTLLIVLYLTYEANSFVVLMTPSTAPESTHLGVEICKENRGEESKFA